MDDGGFDRLARRVASGPSRRSVVGGGLAAVGAALATVTQVGVDGEAKAKNKNKKKRENKKRKKKRRESECTELAESCSTTAECCTASICSQNGAAIPDRPVCCRGIGQGCLIKEHCCGVGVDCINKKCTYVQR